DNRSRNNAQHYTKENLKAKPLETTTPHSDFHATTIPPSLVDIADGYCAEVARTVGDPYETETMLPPRSRLKVIGTSTRAPAAGPPSAMTRMPTGEVKTAAGLR